MTPLRWAIVLIDLDAGTVGHGQRGERRALIVSYEPFHRFRDGHRLPDLGPRRSLPQRGAHRLPAMRARRRTP